MISYNIDSRTKLNPFKKNHRIKLNQKKKTRGLKKGDFTKNKLNLKNKLEN